MQCTSLNLNAELFVIKEHNLITQSGDFVCGPTTLAIVLQHVYNMSADDAKQRVQEEANNLKCTPFLTVGM